MIIALLSVSTAMASKSAGYGVPVDGYPSAEERALVMWTNAARVDPTEFTSDYKAGGCTTDDFSSDEKKAKDPLYIDIALTEAARYHSTDMKENGCFQHESCDGTDTWVRIGEYYDEGSTMGENIAYGSSDARYTVLSMWMCSHSGHRANIMSGDFNEMGGGVAGTYMTQDFAYGKLTEGEPPVRVAAEYDGAVWADWGDDDAPESLVADINGESTPLKLKYGEKERGIYTASMELADCDEWTVQWETAAGDKGSFPESGAFLAGKCDAEYDAQGGGGGDGGSDGGAGNGEDAPADENGDGVINSADSNPYAVKDVEVVCATGGVDAGALAAVVAALAGMRRRSDRRV